MAGIISPRRTVLDVPVYDIPPNVALDIYSVCCYKTDSSQCIPAWLLCPSAVSASEMVSVRFLLKESLDVCEFVGIIITQVPIPSSIVHNNIPIFNEAAPISLDLDKTVLGCLYTHVPLARVRYSTKSMHLM